MNRRTAAAARQRLLVAAVVVAGCSGGLSRDPLGDDRRSGGGSAGALTSQGGHPTGGSTPGKAGKGGSGGGAGDDPVISSGGANRGGSGGTGTGGSGSRGGSGNGGSENGGSSGESGDGGVGGSVAGSGPTGGRAGGGTSGLAGEGGVPGEGGAAGDASRCDGDQPGGLDSSLQQDLVFWFSADFGVTKEAGRVSHWCDRSGNGSHATQEMADLRPTLGTFAGSDDLPAIVLDGTQYLDLPPQDAGLLQGLTFFCVARITEDPEGSAMVELSNGKELEDVTFFRFQDALTYEVADIVERAPDGSFTEDYPHLVEVVHIGQDASLFLDSTEQTTTISSFPEGKTEMQLPLDGTRSVNTIGRTLYDRASPWPGEISEILLYSRALTEPEREAVRSYLTAKWKCCT